MLSFESYFFFFHLVSSALFFFLRPWLASFLCAYKHAKSLQSCLILCDAMDQSPPGSAVHGDSPGKNTGVGCHALLQGDGLTQALNPSLLCLLHWRADCLLLSPIKVIPWIQQLLLKYFLTLESVHCDLQMIAFSTRAYSSVNASISLASQSLLSVIKLYFLTWMDLETITVSGVSQRRINITRYHFQVKSKIWHKSTYLRNTDRLTATAERACGYQRWKGGKWINLEFGVSRYKPLYIK